MTVHHHEPPHAGPADAGPRRSAVPNPGERGPGPRRRQTLGATILAGVLSAGTVCGVFAYAYSPGGPAGGDVLPIHSAGQHPFTGPVGRDLPATSRLIPAEHEAPGDTPGLYAQDPVDPPCDSRPLVDQLQADPAKAAAWAQVQQIRPEAIPAFADSLIAVSLRTDTAVVDYGYRDGTYVPTPEVLAAGTSVFINSYGEPTVKCYNGDPLRAGESTDPQVAVVAPAATAIRTHVFARPTTDTAAARDVTGAAPVTAPGKPDTTGRGPNLSGPEDSPDDAPDDSPGSDPVPAPPVTGTYNYDGTVTLSDGRILLADGRIIGADLPPGATRLPDGGYRQFDGRFFNADGTERLPVVIFGHIVHPDGSLTDIAGNPITAPGRTIRFNYDGTFMMIDRPPRPKRVIVYDENGTRTSLRNVGPASILHGDGSITRPNGTVLNPDGSPREPVELPGGGTLEPDGTTTSTVAYSAEGPTRESPGPADLESGSGEADGPTDTVEGGRPDHAATDGRPATDDETVTDDRPATDEVTADDSVTQTDRATTSDEETSPEDDVNRDRIAGTHPKRPVPGEAR